MHHQVLVAVDDLVAVVRVRCLPDRVKRGHHRRLLGELQPVEHLGRERVRVRARVRFRVRVRVRG